MFLLKVLKPIANLVSFYKFKTDRLRLQKRIAQGLKVGKNVNINENVSFDDSYPYMIEIGDNCRIAIGVRILAHDATAFRDVGVTRVEPVKILEGSFIGERAIILPGVTIGPRALIAAGSVVNRDIPEGKIAAGNPARPYGNLEDVLEKYREGAKNGSIIKKDDIEKGGILLRDIKKIVEANGVVYMSGVPKVDPYYINTDINKIRENADKLYNGLIEQ